MLRHVGIIMDGNGRWAKERTMPRSFGHKVGAEVVEKIAKYAAKTEIEVITLYAFSTENWKRPQEEVDYLMELFEKMLSTLGQKIEKDYINLKFIGDRSKLKSSLVEKMTEIEENAIENPKLTMILAINYGGRDEIIRAANKAISEGNVISCEKDFEKYLDTNSFGDPDLIIRTGGEQRLSGFLLWQAAYAEFMFLDKYWPDFNEKDIDKAIEIFSKRERRMGGLK